MTDSTTADVEVDRRYDDVRDRRLARALTVEDAAELGGVDPFERLTCRTHRRWVHECIAAQSHVVVVTGHRWCRGCECVASVAVDHLTWNVAVTCPICCQPPQGPATKQIIRTCRASLAAARGR